MKRHSIARAVVAPLLWCAAANLVFPADAPPSAPKAQQGLQRYIYAALPDGSQHCIGGTRGKEPEIQGIVVLDIDDGCRYIKTITTPAFAEFRAGFLGEAPGHPGLVLPFQGGIRGICGHTGTRRLWYTFKGHPWGSRDKAYRDCAGVLGCLDVETGKPLWEVTLFLDEDEKSPKHRVGCGELAVTPDGKKLYVTNENPGSVSTVWDAATGRLLATLPTGSGGVCGNAIMSPDGKVVYIGHGAQKVDTATDKIVAPKNWCESPGAGAHFSLDATGKRLYATWDVVGRDCSCLVFSTETGKVLDRFVPPETGPLSRSSFKGGLSRTHEGSFTPGGDRFWLCDMGGSIPRDLVSQFPRLFQVADGAGEGRRGGKLMTEWDVSKTPATLVRAIEVRSPGHCHAHALVTREGDLLLTGNGYALDVATGEVKGIWKDENGKWFQCTKFLQVNFRDGKVDWVGQRHGAGWLYDVPALSEKE